MMNEFNNSDEEEQVAAALFGKDKTRWNETESNFTFEMDVPGVKAHHITIEEKEGEIEVTALRMKDQEVAQTFQNVFYVRPSKANLSGVVATLSDGVLTIAVPKKIQEPLELAVKQEAAPAAAEEGQEFRVSLDLPGVKPANLKIQARDDKVYVEATRSVGDRTIRIRRMVHVEPSNADTSQAQLFLQDGVFTMIAPVPEGGNSKSGALRTIRVQEDVPEMGSLSLDENGENEGGSMVVETVAETEQDWEAVGQDKMKKQD